MTLTKAEIVEKIVNQLEYSHKDSKDMVENVISILKHTLESGNDVKISGFGKFEVKQKNARKGRNPQTGESITLEPRKIITFKASKLLRERINSESP